mmetsp:Transcript_8587/g.26059  ORF Transcript_8587/g.26059 Transcript_8587/m.26059 type:complete len:227 (-) Transcript_8587:52-732(-)|eukprot:141035-Chlamydomonas_euryale.AAC.7
MLDSGAADGRRAHGVPGSSAAAAAASWAPRAAARWLRLRCRSTSVASADSYGTLLARAITCACARSSCCSSSSSPAAAAAPPMRLAAPCASASKRSSRGSRPPEQPSRPGSAADKLRAATCRKASGLSAQPSAAQLSPTHGATRAAAALSGRIPPRSCGSLPAATSNPDLYLGMGQLCDAACSCASPLGCSHVCLICQPCRVPTRHVGTVHLGRRTQRNRCVGTLC